MSIKIENVEISGWKAAIRGARNPMNSWEKSDSAFFAGINFARDLMFRDINDKIKDFHDWLPPGEEPSKKEIRKWAEWNKKYNQWKEAPFPKPVQCADGELKFGDILIGPNDHKLLMNLCKGGSEESKWRRFVHVSMDITAPLYWWKEFETYKVGVSCNSCSTMHKIQAKEFTLDDFSCEHLFDWPKEIPVSFEDEDEANWHYENGAWLAYEDWDDHDDWVIVEYALDILKETITALNYYRKKFIETKNKKYWWQMIQLLPSSYNQRRTIDLNYEVLAAQYRQRKDHKLDEWHQYCDWIKTLPYSELITLEES